jgi:MFS family permease
MRLSRKQRSAMASTVSAAPNEHAPLDAGQIRMVSLLMLAGFAIEGFVLSAILLHMVPLLAVLGLGTTGIMVSALFGPSQVASRLINMIFGGRLSQTLLAVIAASLLAAGLLILVLTSPSVPGIALFAILFGLGSGLTSIVGGTLPLELFGRAGYGARLGWVSAARQFSSSFAPFIFALMMAQWSIGISLWSLVGIGSAGTVTFAVIALVHLRSQRKVLPRDGALLPAD